MRAGTRIDIALLGAAALIISGCSRNAAVADAPRPVSVPVAIGCVAGQRPKGVTALRDQMTAAEWRTKTPRQKAALVGAQSLRRMNYGEALKAATGGCR